jgi:YbbR domain-containing protein
MFLLNGRKLLAKVAENWPVKVLSIVFALVLFIFHRMSTLEDRFFSVSLNVEMNGNLIPSSPYPRMIRLSLRGDANSIYPILEDDIEAYIDLTKYSETGTYRAPVQIRKKGTALGVEPLEIGVDPLEISLELDYRVSKYVPLTPNMRGYPEQGYELISYTLNPTQMLVEGPMNIMNGISELLTDFIELDGRTEDFSVMVNILNRDPLMMIRGNGMTEFRGFVREFIILRNFEDVPVAISGLDERFRAEPEINSVNIRFEGAQQGLENYTLRDQFLFLDCSEIEDPGVYVLPVKAVDSPGLNLVRIEPEKITVHISLASGEEP